MSWALRELGLRPDADERAIKRAYAAKLKTTRPEDDPEGFQRLHEAYQAALDWMRSREADADIDEDIDEDIHAFAEDAPPGAMTRTLPQAALFELLDGDSPGMPSPDLSADRQTRIETAADIRDATSDATFADRTLPDESARFDPDAFVDACIALAIRSRDDELLAWLNAQPALWSLAQKTHITPWLLHRLHEQRPPIEARRFDILAEFFGLLDLHSGYDAYSIQRLRHRLHLGWAIETRQIRALAERTGQDGGSLAANLRQASRMLKQLARPLRLMQALWAGLVPGYPSAVRNFLRRLDFGNLDALPTSIREDQIAFWDAAGDRSKFSAPRMMIGAARCIAYATAATFALMLVDAMSQRNFNDPAILLKTGVALPTAMLAAWLTWIGARALVEWQCLPESAQARFGRLRRALIPLIALFVFGLQLALAWNLAAAVLSLLLFLMAWHRYRQRNGAPFGFVPRRPIWYVAGLGILLVPGLDLLGSAPLAVIGGICASALALWAVDMYKQRAARQD